MLYLFHYKIIDPQKGLRDAVTLSQHPPLSLHIISVRKGRKLSFKTQNLIHLVHHIHQMLCIPLPISEVVRILSYDHPDPMVQAFLRYLYENLSQGHSLYAALEPAGLPAFLLTRLYVGENTGNLRSAFEDIEYLLKQKFFLEKELMRSIRYPCFLLMTLCLVCIVLGLSIPQVSFLKFVPLTFLITAIILCSTWRFFLFHFLSRDYWITQTVTQLGYLLKGHIPLKKALEMTQKSLPNVFIKDALSHILFRLEKGSSLKAAFSETFLGTQMIQEVIHLGEEVGELGLLFIKTSHFLTDQWIQKWKRTLALVEPVLITFIGLIIVWIIHIVILPMYNDVTSLTT